MMQTFPEYISQRLTNNGYRCKRETEHDLFVSADDNKPVWICYLAFEITPEQIRRCFEFPGHILFVVDEKLIPQEIVSRTETPMWLRVLHGLYMGRIYVWNGRYLFGLHFDYDTGDVSESGIIQPDELLLTETGTWLRGWPGTYRLARFYDRAWWQENAESFHETYTRYKTEREKQERAGNKQAPPKQDESSYYGSQQSNARQEYEQARDRYQQAQREREQKTNSKYSWERDEWYVPPELKPEPSKPDFMREFAKAGSPSAVKALYRELAKKFHPDLNPGVDTTAEMQAINQAYERWK